MRGAHHGAAEPPAVMRRTATSASARQNANSASRRAASIDELREQARRCERALVGFIKERPGTSLLIALGAGFLIGRMLRS